MGIPFFLVASVLCLLTSLTSSCASSEFSQGQSKTDGRRLLLNFKELRGNTTFECSPSGPCVACHYSEKNDERYHCSETGYRIPFKCVEVDHALGEANGQKFQKGRHALEGDSKLYSSDSWSVHPSLQKTKDLASFGRYLGRRVLMDGSSKEEQRKTQHYMIFKSCVPTVDEEKLTVLGFEIYYLLDWNS